MIKNVSEVRERNVIEIVRAKRGNKLFDVTKLGSFCVLALNLFQSCTLLFILLESASHTKSNYRAIMLLSTGLDLLLGVLSVVNASIQELQRIICSQFHWNTSNVGLSKSYLYILFDCNSVRSAFPFSVCFLLWLKLAISISLPQRKELNLWICLRRCIASAEVIVKQCRWFWIHRKEKARTK